MPRLRLPAIPYPHFMAFAPLDAWLRMLYFPPVWVPPRYWLRLGFAVFSSAIGTVLTLPERLLLSPILWYKARQSGAVLNHKPGSLVILGYFRSGTTHLHYLLSCDPQFRTPRWCEALAPQGFAASWWFLRIFLIPFIAARRPQDDVAYGPEWPAEDDFANCNWVLASSMPARFILPRKQAHYARFHALEGLTPREYRRWRLAQWAFCWKVSVLARRRRLLLKSPSHTARVRDLTSVLGEGRVKFIYIRREPEAVIRSNVAMYRRLQVFNLQDPPPSADVEGFIRQEYERTNELCEQHTAHLSPEDLISIRYEDLVADPLGQLRAAYAQLGLTWTPEFETRAAAYLDSVRDYRPATPINGSASPPPPTHEHRREQPRYARAIALALTTSVILVALWVTQAWFTRDRLDWLAWPAGITLGLVTLRSARAGTPMLGIMAAALTLLVFASVAVPATFVADYFQRPYYRDLPISEWEWYHILKSARVGATGKNNLFWLFMGVVTAYRFASRRNLNPPGT